jgi:hypothetical protein
MNANVTLRPITVVYLKYTTNVDYSSDFVNTSCVGVGPK